MPETEQLTWDPVSRDYLEHRSGYPADFFDLLKRLGIGRPGQTILDLGTGTGALAIPFTEQGAEVVGVDRSEGQIQAGREAARRAGVKIKFITAPAEETGLPDHAFEVISASMCWGYFDVDRMKREVRRLLRPGGVLLLSSLIWNGAHDAIAGQTDKLVARYNAKSSERTGNAFGEVVPDWSRDAFHLKTYHEYETTLPFTRESWRGRMRATKWIGAALPPEQVGAFDREHAALLERIAPPAFSIRHDIRIQIFAPVRG